MRVDHIAVWTNDIERMKAFSERYFDARAAPATGITKASSLTNNLVEISV